MIPASRTPATVSAESAPRSRAAWGLTRRGLLLFLAGALFLAPAFFRPRMAWGMAAWDAVILVMALLDAWSLPAPGKIAAERVWKAAPSLGNETEIEIGLTQEGDRQLRCVVTDDLTSAFTEAPCTLSMKLYPTGRSKGAYRFMPRERGDHVTGRLYLRYRSAGLGLAERWAVADLSQPVRVYPSVRPNREQTFFLTRSKQIELQQRLLRQRGLGRDFESLREYREGDDIRDLCWTATARRGLPITRQYQTEKSQPVWLLVDAGRLLQARVATADGKEEYTRLDYATATAVALAQLAL
ncbi:MAG TPA: DUF58 domain-containing protein, partial [Acidobacteriaceae bacterium]|nr:DUF58 domain-containing protein [Acidobacteriaceae bacterium]